MNEDFASTDPNFGLNSGVSGDSNLHDLRSNYANEFQDPTIRRAIFNLTHNEVGNQGPTAKRAFMESLFNRAAARGQSLGQTIFDHKYYPDISYRPARLDENDLGEYDGTLNAVTSGSNISHYATGNGSGNVRGGPTTKEAEGEHFVVENQDVGWQFRRQLQKDIGESPRIAGSPTKESIQAASSGFASNDPNFGLNDGSQDFASSDPNFGMDQQIHDASPVFHRIMDDVRRFGSSTGRYIFSGLSGSFEKHAEELEAKKDDKQAVKGAKLDRYIADFLNRRAKRLGVESGIDPNNKGNLDAMLSDAAGPAVVGAGELMIPVAGMPLMAMHGAMAARNEALQGDKTQAQADRAAAQSFIGLAIFGGMNRFASLGAARLLPQGASRLTRFLGQFMAQDAANEASSRGIAAWNAAQAAPEGEKLAAATKPFMQTPGLKTDAEKEQLSNSVVNAVYAAFGAAGASRARRPLLRIGGETDAQKSNKASSQVFTEQRKSALTQAEVQAQARDPRYTLTRPSEEQAEKIAAYNRLAAQAKVWMAKGVTIPESISEQLQSLHTDIGHFNDLVSKVDPETGARSAPKGSPFAPVDPPNSDPIAGKVQRSFKGFRDWWEKTWPRSAAVIRLDPNSPVISAFERFLNYPDRMMRTFSKTNWWGGIRRMNQHDFIEAEHQAVMRARALREGGMSVEQARETAVSEAPSDLQTYMRHRMARVPIEESSSDELAVPREEYTADPYVPRLAKNDVGDVVELQQQYGNWGKRLKEAIGSFGKGRVFASMKEGIQKVDQEYEHHRNAIWRREEFSYKLEATANFLNELKSKGVLFDTKEAAAAAPASKDPIKVTGFGGKEYWAKSRQEGRFLELHLNPKTGSASAMSRITRIANNLMRDPNFVNPLPHTTKNMLFKYVLARVTQPIFRRDIADFRANKDNLRSRFERVADINESGDRLDNMRVWQIGNWAEKLAATPQKALGYSRRFTFGWADPAMRYSLWKSYVRKGMGDQEAMNHTWIDLIRYNENSGALNFWREIPTNFFATWRTGTLVTLLKQTQRAPIRTALFLGAVDYLREVIYRKSGLWTHMPHDYIEAPMMEAIMAAHRVPAAIKAGESPARAYAGAAGSTAGIVATTLAFGPGGGQAPSTIKDVMGLLQGDPQQTARVMNMFWGLSLVFNTPSEFKKFQADGNPAHLAKIAANAAFSTHSALKYEPRRFAAMIPENWPWMQKSAQVLEAEQLRQRIEQRQMKGEVTREQRHGVSRTFEYTSEEQQMEDLRRGTGTHQSTSSKPRKPRRSQ